VTLPADPWIVPLRSRRQQRGMFVQKLEHAIPALVLLFLGLSTLKEGASGLGLAVAIAEIVSSVLLLVAMARAAHRLRRPHPSATSHAHGVDWIDIFAATMLGVEALEKWQTHHHLARPTIMTALVLLIFGIFHSRIVAKRERRRTLRISDAGLYVGGRPFRGLHAAWTDIESIEVDERWARVRTRGGQERRLDLADLENPAAIRDALEAARARAVQSGGV